MCVHRVQLVVRILVRWWWQHTAVVCSTDCGYDCDFIGYENLVGIARYLLVGSWSCDCGVGVIG